LFAVVKSPNFLDYKEAGKMFSNMSFVPTGTFQFYVLTTSYKKLYKIANQIQSILLLVYIGFTNLSLAKVEKFL